MKGGTLMDTNSNRDSGFIKVPKAVIEGGRYRFLSADAILLYGLILDRMGLSRRNSFFHNSKGSPFVIYTNEEIQEKLRCRHQKASKALRELELAQLIRIERNKSPCRANKIYVTDSP